MRRTCRNTLLVATLIGAAACDERAPTAVSPIAPTTPRPPSSAEFATAVAMLGRPLPRLSGAQRQRFEVGRAVFQTNFTPETGLGPLFNAVGCAACHENPVPGGGGNNDPTEGGEDIEVHATAFHGAAAPCEDLAAVGGQVIQKQVTPALADLLHITSEPIPLAATDSGHRTTPDLFGFGLLDAVPDAVILARADPLDRNGDGISGRPNRTADGRLGRFGRKAQAATLREFDGADAFVRFLAPPTRARLDAVGVRGTLVFAKIGCTACHVPALVTGANPIAALRFKVVPAFTDLLLHDMGPELADICLGQAQPSEFRTEPLMGLRF